MFELFRTVAARHPIQRWGAQPNVPRPSFYDYLKGEIGPQIEMWFNRVTKTIETAYTVVP